LRETETFFTLSIFSSARVTVSLQPAHVIPDTFIFILFICIWENYYSKGINYEHHSVNKVNIYAS